MAKNTQKAFKELVSIAGRSLKHAQGLPAQVDIKPHWSGVGFKLLGQHFVAPLGEVVESLEVPSYARIPGVQSWVRGVSNVRGRLLPILDLNSFFDQHSASARKRRRVIIVELGDVYSGLVVDEVLGMQHFPMDSYSSEGAAVATEIQPYIKGFYNQLDVEWAVFSLHALASSDRFFQVEADA